MADFRFSVEAVEPVPCAVVPQVAFRLRITDLVPDRTIHSAMLQCRLDIEPSRRSYDKIEQERLFDLFDRPERWGRTLRRMPWTEVAVVVPSFTGSVVVDLRVTCSRDLESAATRYFFALNDGVIPLSLSVRGTAFHETEAGALRVLVITSAEATTSPLPVSVWQDVRHQSEPNCGWIRVRRDVLDRLGRFKTSQGLVSWEQAVEALLTHDEEGRHGDLAG